MFSQRRGLILGAVALSGCAGSKLPGHLFDLTLTGTSDTCHKALAPSIEHWTYRVVVEGANAQLFIGEGALATGRLSGCELSYRSGVFTDSRPTGDVRWSIQGTATVALGDACDAGDGWIGTEEITIVSSQSSEVETGCTYGVDVEGAYAGEVAAP